MAGAGDEAVAAGVGVGVAVVIMAIADTVESTGVTVMLAPKRLDARGTSALASTDAASQTAVFQVILRLFSDVALLITSFKFYNVPHRL